MPDRRRHRGPHPADPQLFDPTALPALRTAVAELSWLLGRGYAEVAALKLVGDRHALRERQRTAVLRCACADDRRDDRRSRRRELDQLAGADLVVDGFNCIITSESALSGGLVLIGRDGAHRDLASVHGSYRRVEETERALDLIAGLLRAAAPRSVTWYLDRPVSNSGRLRGLIEQREPSWRVQVVYNPDRALAEQTAPVTTATADAWVLDRCTAWVDLPAAVAALATAPWVVDLSASSAA